MNALAPINSPSKWTVSTHPRDHIPDRIKRTARTIGYALWLNEPEAWLDAMAIMAVRLSPQERAGLALAILDSLPFDTAELVAEEAIFGRQA